MKTILTLTLENDTKKTNEPAGRIVFTSDGPDIEELIVKKYDFLPVASENGTGATYLHEHVLIAPYGQTRGDKGCAYDVGTEIAEFADRATPGFLEVGDLYLVRYTRSPPRPPALPELLDHPVRHED